MSIILSFVVGYLNKVSDENCYNGVNGLKYVANSLLISAFYLYYSRSFIITLNIAYYYLYYSTFASSILQCNYNSSFLFLYTSTL